MASCKDCVHVEVCCEKNLHVAVGMNIIPRFKYKRIEQECKNFKDRSRFVELPHPLKVGDVVFFILEDLDDDVFDCGDYLFRIGNCAVASGDMVTEVGTSGFWYRGLYHDGRTTTFVPDSDDFVRWEDVGKDVFLTYKEAEAALKERET